ncbi:MAG: chemotaxis protein, partial [Clostridia bacterium]|nr:chemotaxis protein [Clostridia bacterium]
CPVEILREREKARGDRCVGSAESSFTYLFPKDGYDIEVDTHKITADECAEKIIHHLNK